jgi:small conductance mechanosensitive channel
MNLASIQDTAVELAVKYGPPILGVMVLLFVAWIASRWVGRLVGGAMRRARVDETLTKFSAKLSKWVVLMMAAIACLGVFGVETTSFAAVIGAAGLAIGLAFQGTLANFSSGVMLLIFRPFKVGDLIEVAGELGTVDEIELFTSTLDTKDNRRIIIPNSQIFGAVIENLSANSTRRVDVAVGVSYDADVDETREVLTQAAERIPGRRHDPPPQVILLNLGGSSVDWEVRVWTTPDEYWDIRDAAIREVKLALDAAGIGIPYPQMDVHFDRGTAIAMGSHDRSEAA